MERMEWREDRPASVDETRGQARKDLRAVAWMASALTPAPGGCLARSPSALYSLVILRNGVVIQTVLPMKSTVAPPASSPTTRPNPYESCETRSSTAYASTTDAG